MIEDIPTPDIEPQSFAEANVRGDLDELMLHLKDSNRSLDPCLMEPANSYETVMWASPMFSIPFEIRERHLMHYEQKDRVEVQAAGTHLQILFSKDGGHPVRLRLLQDGWFTGKQFSRSLTDQLGVNLNRWFDKLWSAKEPKKAGDRKAVLLQIDVLDMEPDDEPNGMKVSWGEDDE